MRPLTLCCLLAIVTATPGQDDAKPPPFPTDDVTKALAWLNDQAGIADSPTGNRLADKKIRERVERVMASLAGQKVRWTMEVNNVDEDAELKDWAVIRLDLVSRIKLISPDLAVVPEENREEQAKGYRVLAKDWHEKLRQGDPIILSGTISRGIWPNHRNQFEIVVKNWTLSEAKK
jgi:hypothetical protein